MNFKFYAVIYDKSFITLAKLFPMRLLKFFMIFLSSIFGLFGFYMALTIIVIKIASITSFDIPYTKPIAPFNYEDMKNYISSNVVQTEH
ncbi:spore germination protein [Clostridium sp. JS66]|uniref:spore germination protein n=1 Tax=Clostridium sp. JS66 TaxID=3064705 RepID=UPI00298E8486|nr:spore germination protein [Clostridium sp. JS66]WPC39993.1 spore germination protein [Clostridium sp. JS66]